MKRYRRIARFSDSLSSEQVAEVLRRWEKPDLPAGCSSLEEPGKFPPEATLEWLYAFIRLNVKRGRVFDLQEVLGARRADCLGYSKLFTMLGRYLRLDTGVVEVITDVRGKNVPHTAVLVRLSGGSPPDNYPRMSMTSRPCLRFVDLWYGSTDICHKRLGLRVKSGGRWKNADVNYAQLQDFEDTGYLPDRCVDAITLYIRGNRFLKNGEYLKALEEYSRAVRLYPLNARVYYNRAVAYERLGEMEKAKADYARALRDEPSVLRTLAVQTPDIVGLIQMDEHSVPETSQQVFLLHAGFLTGKKTPPAAVARKMGLSLQKVKSVLEDVKRVVRSTEAGNAL